VKRKISASGGNLILVVQPNHYTYLATPAHICRLHQFKALNWKWTG